MFAKLKPLNVKVTTIDAELEFAIQGNTTGRQLFDQVVKTIGLREVWYFGLQHLDSKDEYTWLKLNRKVATQDVKKTDPLLFRFRAKFFPEDVAEELIEPITQRLFFLQVKESIVSDEFYCPPETAVLLASYACQAKYSDYTQQFMTRGFLAHDRVLPMRIKEQHSLTDMQWEDKIVHWYKEHKNMLREEAMTFYLKIAQDLEMYGVSYFEIKNKRGTDLWLGIDALGLNIYQKDDRLTPKIGFPWCEIRNISFSDKKFTIKPIDKKSPDFVFFVSRLRTNKRILALCMGNHELYMRRRKPDTIEVQQMKAQAKEERMQKVAEKERLQLEMEAREAAESRIRELEAQLASRQTSPLQEDRPDSPSTHMDALERRIHELQSQLATQSLERKELEMEKQQATEDKRRLSQENESLRKQLLALQEVNNNTVADIPITNGLKDTPSRSQSQSDSLDAGVKASRYMQTSSAVKEDQINTEDVRAIVPIEEVPPFEVPSLFEDEVVLNSKNDLQPLDNGDIISFTRSEMEYQKVGNGVSPDSSSEMNTRSAHHEFGVIKGPGQRSEEHRQSLMHKDMNLRDQLQRLSKELRESRRQGGWYAEDLRHEANIAHGVDKFKTLRQIRQGNTKKRVDEFESM
ncbi:hypothetical protein Ciccas_002349 [Cichlidogyrus casuarinus]|uniref:FERM domain-containing protein n=1 Tax=Cichlidogyrus casuarinus TaxID=1844966 RepID=A0ABD2QJN9_9PLAT